ncbi:MAG: hypothetical protein C0614_08220 [Desulfuromonas sp.]|nr:MAG: hypothetical protein C0614_08220 [Desulfuromonas sp.]
MSDSAFHRKPPVLLGSLIFTSLLLLIGRGAFFKEGSALSFAVDTAVVHVELGAGFQMKGNRQFSNAVDWNDVISMTHGVSPGAWLLSEGCPATIESGLYLEVVEDAEKTAQIRCRWMPAEHRIVLRIPLHPDRMSKDDWIALPGIGQVLAERIELDRQSNGEFGDLSALQRVSGIGPKRIAAWKDFFELSN